MQVAVRKRQREPAIAGLADLARQVREAHQQSVKSANASMGHAIDAGAVLIRVKSMLAHGDFQRWLAKKLPEIPDRTARLYMQIHANRDKITENGNAVAVLSLRRFAEKLRAESPRPMQPIVRRLTPLPPGVEEASAEARRHKARSEQVERSEIPRTSGVKMAALPAPMAAALNPEPRTLNPAPPTQMPPGLPAAKDVAGRITAHVPRENLAEVIRELLPCLTVRELHGLRREIEKKLDRQ